MSVIAGYMVPHPPLIIPEVGRGDEKEINNTTEAYEKVAEEIADLLPETVVIISPHNTCYGDYIHIRPEAQIVGDFGRFRAPEIRVTSDSDAEFANALSEVGGELWGIEGGSGSDADHGTTIPMYFLERAYEINNMEKNYKVVSIGISGLPLQTHYQLGEAISRTAAELNRKTVIIASGDLSHYLKADGPYGYREEGPKYDKRLMEIMENGAFYRLQEIDEEFLNSAGECGHRGFVMMSGALERAAEDAGVEIRSRKLSYEGPFGVGYGITAHHIGGDPYVALARASLENYVKTGKVIALPDSVPAEMRSKRAGAFVSIHKNGDLRGCIGTISATRDNLADEIIENAVSAATRDPRFPAIEMSELPELEISVDVLGDAEEISSIDDLDVKRYGVIVTKGSRRGLLLPNLDGVDTPEYQVHIAKMKAGIAPGEEGVKLERFEVVRHK